MKRRNRIWIPFLCFCLCFCVSLPILANTNYIKIRNADEFIQFAKHCKNDQFSVGKIVTLENDIDLKNKTFYGIPSFSGEFDGKKHTIKGIKIQHDASNQGCFRYVTKQGVIKNVTIDGQVTPKGSRKNIGGIVGRNSGKLESCIFKGEVSGDDYVGGIVGVNELDGRISNCQSRGDIHGNHFVGGIVGENLGIVQKSRNHAKVNTTEKENSISLSEITTATILNTEAANIVTDIGGIVGTNNGTVTQCENEGTIGYPHMGYNIGGVVGSHRGYLSECKNHGTIYGRKEVAGIAGQMEPMTKIEYQYDTIQLLEQHFKNISTTTQKVSKDAQDHKDYMHQQLDQIKHQSEVALDAIQKLNPQEHEDSLDKENIKHTYNIVNGAVSSIQGTFSSLVDSVKDDTKTRFNLISDITDEVQKMSQTISNSDQNVGVKIQDISDLDKNDQTSGVISKCENRGAISGDLNAGGIVGIIAWENDLDPEDDVQLYGNQSLHIQSNLKALIIQSKNCGKITAKKKNAGGIAGKVTLGSIQDSVNTGFIDSKLANFVGGISGDSSGYIRNCYDKSELSGKTNIGGIAGRATIVTDCYSIVDIQEGQEKMGSILGEYGEDILNPKEDLIHNYYLELAHSYGGIDGIGYENRAQALTLDEFLKQSIPSIFKEVEITFKDQDKVLKTITLPLGGIIKEKDIPKVPNKKGHVIKWNQDIKNKKLYFDTTISSKYEDEKTVIESSNKRNNKPILLVEGEFQTTNEILLKELKKYPSMGNDDNFIEGWKLPEFDEKVTRIHFLYPSKYASNKMKLIGKNKDGKWLEIPTTKEGSYLVFKYKEDIDELYFAVHYENNKVIYGSIGVGIVALLLFGIHKYKKRKLQNK